MTLYEATNNSEILTLRRKEESSLQTTIQIFIPFIIAGCGTIGAGILLDNVQHWPVFKNIDEIYILLPSLLGLKGNLEMTLASRLSTHVNLGDMNTKNGRFKIIFGNIALTQCQATIVSLLACILASTINFIYTGSFDVNDLILITAAALLTAATASLILGLMMIFVVLVARSCDVNPDNIATPIAASFGDLITLSLYAILTSSFYSYKISKSDQNQFDWLNILIIFTYILLIPVWVTITRKNKFTRDALYNGWTPILAAMIISSVSGVILNVAISKFTGLAVFHPVICGVGGNLVAVQASRLSTHLHKSGPLGLLPIGSCTGEQEILSRIHLNPITVIFGNNSDSRTSRLLMAMAVPGHLFFVAIIELFQFGHKEITVTFLLIYTLAGELQIVILLYLTYILTCFMWCKSIDPDNSSIPYLTAIGDLLGTAFLSCAFVILS